MEKDYVNYILNGNPGIPDEELPTPDEQIADIGKNLASESTEEKIPDKWDKVRKLYDQGLDDKTIAAQLGLPHSNTVMWWRRKANLPPNKTNGLPAKNHKTTASPESVTATERPETIDKQELVAEMKADIYEAKETCKKMQDNLPDSQIVSLAAITLKLLLLVWKRIGKEEPI